MDNLELSQYPQSIKVFRLDSIQGTYLVKHFLSQEEQIQLTKDCINDYVFPPYRTNENET